MIAMMDWQELMILSSYFMVVVPFIAGLVMLIVGLSVKKRGLWKAGMVLMIIPAVVALLAVLMLLGLA